MAIEVSEEEFEELVEDALERIPDKLLRSASNVALVTEDYNPHSRNILGLYQGIALTERNSEYSSVLPDKITIYRKAICDRVHTREELIEQVAITVIHELGHHFGIDDARLHDLGWG